MPKITPFLWFDTQAEAAAAFYVAIFPNSRITRVARRPKGVPGETGDVLLVEFELDGQPHLAMNGGPGHNFTDAVSLMVLCKTQAEIDRYWSALTGGGGGEIACGWLKDKYGFHWQVAPESIAALLSGPDRAKSERVMAAVMGMVKLDLKRIEEA